MDATPHGCSRAPRALVTGQVVRVIRERCRTADTQAFAEELGRERPKSPSSWSGITPPAPPKLVRQAAEVAHIQIAFLPFGAPELMPCEDLWRRLKAVVAESSGYADITELAVTWLDSILRWIASAEPESPRPNVIGYRRSGYRNGVGGEAKNFGWGNSPTPLSTSAIRLSTAA